MNLKILKQKAKWLRSETLKLHLLCPETRIASSLSCIEILTVLYLAKIIKFNPENIYWEERDRFIISKGHGSLGMYPLLASLGFFNKIELLKIGKRKSILSGIPDPMIPGYETINGSLGHGLGVACGLSLALKLKKNSNSIFVLSGDGELNEGSVWEAVMFASHYKLDNLILIVDCNKISMLDYCQKTIDLEPLQKKFSIFGWRTFRINGHNIKDLYNVFMKAKNERNKQPKVIIADTIKGKGVPSLENDPLCHIKTLSEREINELLEEKNEH